MSIAPSNCWLAGWRRWRASRCNVSGPYKLLTPFSAERLPLPWHTANWWVWWYNRLSTMRRKPSAFQVFIRCLALFLAVPIQNLPFSFFKGLWYRFRRYALPLSCHVKLTFQVFIRRLTPFSAVPPPIAPSNRRLAVGSIYFRSSLVTLQFGGNHVKSPRRFVEHCFTI